MTGCIVYVYDDKLSAVASPFIEILEYDAFYEILDLKVATSLGPNEFGAQLTLPNPPEPIVILVDDTSGHFAPISLGYLNGRVTARLDVTLYALPQFPEGRGGGPRGPRRRGGLPPQRFSEPGDTEVLSTAAIARQINQQVESNNWNYSEALAVRSLADTAVRAMIWSRLDPRMADKVSGWLQQLESLGITITTDVQFTSMLRRDSSSEEAYANQDPDYDRSRYSRRQGRDYDNEHREYGYTAKRDYPYERDRYSTSEERDYPYRRDRYGAGGRGYRNDRDLYDSNRERNYEYEHDRYGSGEERGWWDRTSDEVASWFGDEGAEHRRRLDQRQPYRGRGPRGYRRSDERIREDVNDRLSDDYYLDASDMEVTVTNGELTLTGTVNSRAEKRRAEDIAESVAGVTNVENRLRVKQSVVEGYRSTVSTGTTAAMGTETTTASSGASAAADSGTTNTTATTRGAGRTRT